MPTNRRRRRLERRKNNVPLDERSVRAIETGRGDVVFGGDIGEASPARDRAEAFWDAHGAEIVARGVEARPGYRCWGWWEWESPERRQRVNGEAHPHDRDDFYAPKTLFYGLPRCWCRSDDGGGFETQTEYLSRLALLAPGEADRAAQADPYLSLLINDRSPEDITTNRQRRAAP